MLTKEEWLELQIRTKEIAKTKEGNAYALLVLGYLDRALAKIKELSGNTFYRSKEWQRLRYQTLKVWGSKCMCCGIKKGVMHVDHIKPRSKYPELELSFDNLQVLCEACNKGKSNLDETDWRPHKRDR